MQCKFNRFFLILIIALSISLAFALPCFAQQSLFKFSNFKNNNFVFWFWNTQSGYSKFAIPQGDINTTVKSDSTLFYNSNLIKENNSDSEWWSAVDFLQMYAVPATSPLITLNGYKGSTVTFSLNVRFQPSSTDSFVVKNDVKFNHVDFGFYSQPGDWSVYKKNVPEVVSNDFSFYKTDFTLSEACVNFQVTFKFTVPDDSYSIYGFFCTLGSTTSDYDKLNIHFKSNNNSVDFWLYDLFFEFSDIIFDNDPALLDYGSPAPSPDLSEAESALTQVDDLANSQSQEVKSFFENYGNSFINDIGDLSHPLTRAISFCTQVLNEIFSFDWINSILLWSAVLGVLALICGYVLPAAIHTSQNKEKALSQARKEQREADASFWSNYGGD